MFVDYHYENLDPQRFQYLCQSLLLADFPRLQFLPANQRDGGRDAIDRPAGSDGWAVFQVKFTADPSSVRDTVDWITSTVTGELPKIVKLLERGASEYVLVTNVSGTAAFDRGTVDRVQAALNDLIPAPARCLWRRDLNGRLDANASLRWKYPMIVSGDDMLAMLLSAGVGEKRERRDRAIKAFLRTQLEQDRQVKFKEVKLQDSLLDLFVDVPLQINFDRGSSKRTKNNRPAELLQSFESEPDDNVSWYLEPMWSEGGRERSAGIVGMPSRGPIGAARFLLTRSAQSRFPYAVLEGAPGQGKSTLGQYVCQVHRMRLLGETDLLKKVSDEHMSDPVRIPFKVDLRDLADHLTHSQHPSVETFLAQLVRDSSGGVAFSVADLHDVMARSSVLLFFDGLDEVADINVRTTIVKEIAAASQRLKEVAVSVQVIVTSRPAAYATSPAFPQESFFYFGLTSLSSDLITEYAGRWAAAQQLTTAETNETLAILQEKLAEPHTRDLARNPMQLTILLSLVHTRGSSLPDQRTALYDSYVDLFLNREASKSAIVRNHRQRLIEIHRYLAWRLHSMAEGTVSAGRITHDDLMNEVRTFLSQELRDPSIADELFQGMLERVVALVSRVEGTYEFEVQPLREYFCGRYLYETAPYSPAGSNNVGALPARFDAISRNPYWLNVTRFFAGCYSSGELPSLVQELTTLFDEEPLGRSLHLRTLGLLLLQDWVFAQDVRSTVAMVDLCLDEILVETTYFMPILDARIGLVVVADKCARDRLLERMVDWLKERRNRWSQIAVAQVVRENLAKEEAFDWWWSNFGSHATGAQLSTSLTLAVSMGVAGSLELNWTELLSQEGERSERMSTFFSSNSDAQRLPELQRDLVAYVLERPLQSSSLASQSQEHRTDAHILASALSRLFWPRTHRRLDKPHLLRSIADPEGPAAKIAKRILDADIGEGTWQTSLLPWDATVESGRELSGEQTALTFLALAAAGIRSKTERGGGHAALFDDSKSLCQRARHGRLRSNDGEWWVKHADDALDSEQSALLWCGLLLNWGSKDALNTCVEALATIVNSLSEAASDELSIFLRSSGHALTRAPITVFKRPTDLSKSFNGQLARLALGRCGPKVREHLLQKNFRVPRNELGPEELSLALNYEFDELVRAQKWNRALGLAADGTAADVMINWFHQRHELPLSVALQVVERSQEMPILLIAAAQECLGRELAASARKVGEVAQNDEWFARHP
jgi:hypothetical protein